MHGGVVLITLTSLMNNSKKPEIIDLSTSPRKSPVDGTPPPSKKRRWSSSCPIKLFATESDERVRVNNTDASHWSRSQCQTLREMIGIEKHSIDWIVIGTMLLDPDFLLDEVPELVSIQNVVVFYDNADSSLEGWKRTVGQGVHFCQLKPSEPPGPLNPTRERIPYGVHHSKFFLVGFNNGTLRLVIHTANLRDNDIHLKAQAAYIKDFPSKHSSSSGSCPFEDDLVDYFSSYSFQKPIRWDPKTSPESLVERIRRYDFSTAQAVLIPSIPGYHRLDGNHKRGHLKLREAVIQHTVPPTDSNIHRPIVCQYSSIGSLKKDAKYITEELQISMDTQLARITDKVHHPPIHQMKLVYPTVQEIRTSVEGYAGGGSVPGHVKNVKQGPLKSLLHKWTSSKSSNPIWKGSSVPHIKTYYQLNEDDESMAWFVLTSHNLSMAAWGVTQNSSRYNGRRLFIRHWELGVFVSPQTLETSRLLPWTPTTMSLEDTIAIPLPYNIQPERYEQGDEPWAVDASYFIPDRMGQLWV